MGVTKRYKASSAWLTVQLLFHALYGRFATTDMCYACTVCAACLCCRKMMAGDTNKYFINIQPGVDAAFVIALAVLCDELCHD